MLKHHNIVDTTGAFFSFRYRRMNPHVIVVLNAFCTICRYATIAQLEQQICML